MTTKISHKRLLEMLSYDPATGLFTWKVNRMRIKSGTTAGSKEKNGYIVIAIEGKYYKAHRLAYFYVNKKWPKNNIDHINRVRDDNRISNLRDATFDENRMNNSIYSNNTSGFPGVSWHKGKGKWVVKTSEAGKEKTNGAFENLIDAVACRIRSEIINYGEFSPFFSGGKCA
ncbi:HNH endonuclease [Erwinia phyllosphaerae]|uniref:HNH endonuclease n=1 Tax=Erwinia phyllosphaerae TaxID=2853256 RepID=UPI001FEE9E64|nr:HNH endonuclease [Erwinia phyllosphaerae]MBV4365919.1 HNH endonuclease [Erwinia phyllosphaerae]